MNKIARCMIALGLTFLAATAGIAHTVSFSSMNLFVRQNGLEGSLLVHASDLAGSVSTLPEIIINPIFQGQYLPELTQFLNKGVTLEADGSRLEPKELKVEPVQAKQSFRFAFSVPWTRPPRTLRVRCLLFPESPNHVTYVTTWREEVGVRPPVPLTAQSPDIEFATHIYRSAWEAAWAFVLQGVRHIFIGPDHIAFIIGLILLGGSLPRLAKIVTAFTVAHSVTLALATFGILNPPARLIEPLIAFSIVCIGMENLRTGAGTSDRRAAIAFTFGFIHGFGFASVLRELGLPRQVLGVSLFSFNAGVELGQLLIVLAILPLLSKLRDCRISMPPAWGSSDRRALTAVQLLSAAVAMSGAFWLTERLLLQG